MYEGSSYDHPSAKIPSEEVDEKRYPESRESFRDDGEEGSGARTDHNDEKC